MIDLRPALKYQYTCNGRSRAGAFSAASLRRLLEKAPSVRIAVFGDAILDQFIWGDATRISPEAPVPIVLLDHETWALGGAANTAANVRALGAEAALFSVVGEDHAGDVLRRLLSESGVQIGALAPIPKRPTTVKQRVFAQNKHLLRIDRERAETIDPVETRALLLAFQQRLEDLDAVVVSDYAKGCVTSPLLAGLARLCSRRHIPLCIDPKSREIRYRGATLLKPNVRELEELSGVRVNNAASLDAAAARLLRQQTCDYLLVTRGAHGMVLYERNGGRTEICTGAQQVADVTGAGDTAAAALTVAMACGAEPRDAAILANLAAGVVVSKPGTEIVKPQEILAAVGVTSAALRSNIAE